MVRRAVFPSGFVQRCERCFRSSPDANQPGPTFVSPLPRLRLLGHPVRTEFEATLYEPVVCVVLRGRKETTFGDRTLEVGAGDSLLVSHDLPTVSRIVEAPYLALLLSVDLDTLRGLYDELGPAAHDKTETRALEVERATPALLDALARYLALADAPMDARVLGPMLIRELHYRLLTAPFGGTLRSLIRYDSAASTIATAIASIRERFRAPLLVDHLAREVGMSVSAFHRHFKAVTASSPLQYQKDLRLLEAQRLLRTGSISVTSAAFEVGYESPNQFSREYARKFGRPPKTDLAKASEPVPGTGNVAPHRRDRQPGRGESSQSVMNLRGSSPARRSHTLEPEAEARARALHKRTPEASRSRA